MTLGEALDASEHQQAETEYDGYTAYVTNDRLEQWNELSICKEGMPPHYQERFWCIRDVLEALRDSVFPENAEWEPIGDAES